MPPFNNALRAVTLAAVLATLAGCSEYFDRRDPIAALGGNAVETNKVVQMVDPWPRDSANRTIAYNGVVMQTAVDRYHTGRVIPPVGISTGSAYQPSQNSQANNLQPIGPTVTQPAAPVK
ncbi:MAG TPA: hypothetical protein VG986_04205 [Pseudolabrys sp.]|nr:hypothetical protein [Pseudolabrys sp.]